MPKIKNEVGKQLDQILQDVLKTKPNEWNYFFEMPSLIKEIFNKLAEQIKRKNFFNEDYSMEIFLNFLKSYVKEQFKPEELKKVTTDSLMKFAEICRAIQTHLIHYTSGLNNSTHIEIASNYLALLHQLMEPDYRGLWDRPEMSLTSADIQAIGHMLTVNSQSITEDLIRKYFPLLKISFDIPKFLVNYTVGLNIIPLAKTCFLNKELDVHYVITRFFDILGYQGQLLDYYQSSPKFNITLLFLNSATQELRRQVLDLQTYFLKNQFQHKRLKTELLQNYLLKHFFEIIFRKYPDRIENLKTDPSLASYIKFDYVALPNRLICDNFLKDYTVKIEYDQLSTDDLNTICEAIECSHKTHEEWKTSLNLSTAKFNSEYLYRVANSAEEYAAMSYAYGKSPYGAGFYESGKLSNGTVYGEGYSYLPQTKHNLIIVTEHENRHHDNHVYDIEAHLVNPEAMSLHQRCLSEGLATNVNGPCSPDYLDQDFTEVVAPTWDNLFDTSFDSYIRPWLHTNYLAQKYPEFYQDYLTLDKIKFKEKWELRLRNNEQDFFDWLLYLKRVCRFAPRELTSEYCPSPFLKDYEQHLTTTTSLRTPRQITDKIRSRSMPTTKSSHQAPTNSAKPVFYNDYLNVMHLIYNNDIQNDKTPASKILEILKQTNYSFEIVNYRDPNRNLQTTLHYALTISKNCSESIVETLCQFGALLKLKDEKNRTAYQFAENCNNGRKIKTIFDKHLEDLQKNNTHNEAGLSIYREPVLLTIVPPISSLSNGSIAGMWNELKQRYQQHYPYLSNLIDYVFRPISMAIDTAVINSLMWGSASSVGLEEIGLSTAYYLGVNYLGLLFAQFGEQLTQRIQNKLLSLFISILLYTFLINPSLLIELLNEGLSSGAVSKLMLPSLTMLFNGVLFKTGEYGAQKLINKCFPKNSEKNTDKRTYIAYERGGTIEYCNENSLWYEKLMDFKNSLIALQKFFESVLKHSAYRLIFGDNLSLLEDISKLETIEQINEHLDDFQIAVAALEKIQNDLSKLNEISNKKIILKHITTSVKPAMNAVKPSLPVICANESDINKIVRTQDQEQRVPLIFFKNGRLRSTLFGSLYSNVSTDLPPPPTEQELQEMGMSTHSTSKIMK